jgi:hypothetical protein
MLRRVAKLGDEQERLNKLETEFWAKDRSRPVTAAERVSQQVSQPTTQTFHKKFNAAVAEPIDADVLEILNHPSGASISQVEDVLRRAKALRISPRDEESIRQLLSEIAGEKFRGEPRPSELKRLGWQETPVGPADPGTVQSLNRLRCVALARIESCPGHVRNCACYREVRENLLQIVRAFTESQPEGWLALRILGELEA